MTHEDAGHYAKKHQGIEIDKTIGEKLKNNSKDKKISCPAMHLVATELSVTPEKTGIQADLLELRLNHCQLGLFGWDNSPSGKLPPGKLIDKTIQISDSLEKELQTAVIDNRITCIKAWDVAKKLKMKRVDVASACEKRGIKIKKCQLGAF